MSNNIPKTVEMLINKHKQQTRKKHISRKPAARSNILEYTQPIGEIKRIQDYDFGRDGNDK